MRPITALLSDGPGRPLVPTDTTRRDLRDDDVAVRITYCGVCHTDLHALRGHQGPWPLVPGHEFVGEVAEVGPGVTTFAVGDPVAVGNIVDSCGACDLCRAGHENACRAFPTLTYGGTDRVDGSTTLGGFSTDYVVREHFVHHLPAGLDPAAVSPLLCAGVTVWEPLRSHGVGPGTRLGVAGIGGLGHLAVKLGAALGAEVTVLTGTAAKAEQARDLGATHVLLTSDTDAMAAARGTLDMIVDCVPVAHDLVPYLDLLWLDGVLSQVGYLGPIAELPTMALLVGRKRLSSSGSAGVASTRAMLDCCGAHGITADVEVLPAREVGTAMERLGRGDVRYRFVLDLADLREG